MKYLKVNIPLSQEDFDKLTNKLKKLGLEYHFDLDYINDTPREELEEFIEVSKTKTMTDPYIPNPYIYRYNRFENEVEAYPEPPQRYNRDKGISENYGKEFNLEEFLKL